MFRPSRLTALALVTISVACSQPSTSPSSSGAATSLTVSGTAPVVGATAQFTATIAMADNSSRSVTADAVWTSSNTDVATVEGGVVKGVSAGQVDIRATYQNMTGGLHIAVTVSVPAVSAVSVTGTAPAIGASAQFTATATLADNSLTNVTSLATWASSNNAVATVDAGVVKAVSAGEADITAGYQNMSGRVHIVVAAAASPVASVSVNGAGTAVGASSQFTAAARLADNSVTDVTSLATWRSSNPSVATVAGGLVTGVAAGGADISATYQSITGTAHVVIVASANVPPCTYAVSPASLSPTAAGGVFTVNITVSPQSASCSWTATSSDAFLTILSGASGTGNGVTAISVAANTGGARSGLVTIAGKPVTVSQPAGSCVTLVNPGGVQYPAQLWRGKITVTALADCQWTAISTVPFITFMTSPSGTGSGSVTYLVSGNLTGASRSGAITVKDKTLNVVQRAMSGTMWLSFVSDIGDIVGGGWTAEFEPPYASIVPALDASRNHISFSIGGILDDVGAMSWTLDLFAPQGQQLKPGTYTKAALFPEPNIPGLRFSGSITPSCGIVQGQFTITDAVFNADGSVQRFVASFEQHCNGAAAALRGNISWSR